MGIKEAFKDKNEIRSIPIISHKISDSKLLSLLKELHDGLNSEVYDQESIRVIKATKHILDLPALN